MEAIEVSVEVGAFGEVEVGGGGVEFEVVARVVAGWGLDGGFRGGLGVLVAHLGVCENEAWEEDEKGGGKVRLDHFLWADERGDVFRVGNLFWMKGPDVWW